jgi:hypothetical protein
MPQGNPFKNANKSRLGSNVNTGINQGGGNKKAGFPYAVGRPAWTSITLSTTDPLHGQCCKLSSYNTTIFPLARQSRPIGSKYSSNYRKWHIPGVGN